MKTTSLAWLVLLCAGSLAPPPSAAADANPALLGRWLTEAHDGKVGIIELERAADGSYQGRIVGGNTPTRVDAKNPDPAKRQQLLKGQLIVLALHGDDAGALEGGTIYDPDTGRTYKCRIESIDRDHLKVRGFIGFSLIGRSQTWTRFSGPSLDLPPPGH